MTETIRELFEFINASPTGFHAVENIRVMLEKAGYVQLYEKDSWEILSGRKYYVIRGGSAIITFSVPAGKAMSFRIAATHCDSPTFRLKPNAEMEACGAYTVLNTEPYGGGIFHTWMDRPLSVAGRVITESENGLKTQLVYIDRDLLVIPSLAIHMDRDVNKKLELNAQKDILPLFGEAESKGCLKRMIAEAAGCEEDDILGEDLFLYSRVKPSLIGPNEEYICGPRLDDLECVFGTLKGFLADAGKERSAYVPLYCVFDSEEIGSSTKQGAASTFLADVLERICIGLGYGREDYHRMIADSFLVSADNAHAVHPAAAEKADPVNRPVMNRGLVLKYSANQRYITDGVSAAFFHALCREAEIPVQDFSNRSDIPGGSTLGKISVAKVPVSSVDIGLAQLAMHSVCETAGARDLDHLVRFASLYFGNIVSETI